jgi:O-Antigen ligase
MMLNALLAFGIVMSSATQLVVPHSSSTFGELILLLWIFLNLGFRMSREPVHLTPAFARLGSFWLSFALMIGLGLLVGFMTKVLTVSFVLHDSLAYLLLALITCLSAASPDAARHLRQTAWFVTLLASVTLAVQLVAGLGLINISNVNPWYWERFRGWSQNPNQLALYCAIYGPIALHLAVSSKRKFAKFAGFTGLLLPVATGVMTKSDTYILTLIVTSILFVGLRLFRYLGEPRTRNAGSIGRQITILLILATAPFILAMAPYETASISSLVNSVTRDRGGVGIEETTERRRDLWSEALLNGMQSGSLGLGPGPHQEIKPLNEPLYEDDTFEAHNTFLDVYTQGGLLAVCLLTWLGVSAARVALQAHLDALFALMVTLAFFAIPHLIIRHPIVWFAMTLCLVAGFAHHQSPFTNNRRAQS